MAFILNSEAKLFQHLFGRGLYKKHFCEIILKSGQWPKRRCCLQVFLCLALAAILFSGQKRFLQFWTLDTG